MEKTISTRAEEKLRRLAKRFGVPYEQLLEELLRDFEDPEGALIEAEDETSSFSQDCRGI